MAAPPSKRVRFAQPDEAIFTLVVSGSSPAFPVGLTESRFLLRKEQPRFYDPKRHSVELSYDVSDETRENNLSRAIEVGKMIGYKKPSTESEVTRFRAQHNGRVPEKRNFILLHVPENDDRVLVSKHWADPSEYIPLSEIFGEVFAPNGVYEDEDDESDEEEDEDED